MDSLFFISLFFHFFFFSEKEERKVPLRRKSKNGILVMNGRFALSVVLFLKVKGMRQGD